MPTTAMVLLNLIRSHPANRGRVSLAVAKAVGWQVYKRSVGRPINIRAYGGMRFRSYPDSTSPGRLLYFNGLSDFHQMRFMQRYLRPGDAYLDGGAYDGLYALLAAQLVGQRGRVDAFEASPQALARLTENVALNSLTQIHIHAAALSDEGDHVTFVVDRGVGNRIKTPDLEGHAIVEVESVRLDDAVSGRFAMGKLDIEGAEGLALSGAPSMLEASNPPVWQVECVDRFLARFGWSSTKLIHMMQDHGYQVADYDAHTNRLTFEADFVSGDGSAPELLLVARTRRDEVLERLR